LFIFGIIAQNLAKGTSVATINPIKEACKRLKISQKDLAERLGVTERTVSGWATGETPIPEYAIKTLELLEKEQKYDAIVAKIGDIQEIIKK
jgi:transcriptional regulator with XRE-family HTH domain